jgi:hypothetical protein
MYPKEKQMYGCIFSLSFQGSEIEKIYKIINPFHLKKLTQVLAS